MRKQFKIYYEKLKGILLENKYLKKVDKQQEKTIENLQLQKTKILFNNEILLQGIINMYIKELLLKEKQSIIIDYENQQQVQQIYLKEPTFNHSQEHRDLMRNLENLLDNLAKVNDTITEINLTENNIIEKHLKDVLNLSTVNPVILKKKNNMNNMNTFEKILKLRGILLFISKVIAIIFCIYYIMHAKDYKVSWSLFDYLMPTYISKINNMLSSLGTYILVIPLTMILGSILMPESTKLHIMSSLFGIFSIVITTIKNVSTNNATEITNFRLFKVSHILSLDEKREIFITECHRIIHEKFVGMLKVYNYLISKLSGDIVLQYDTVLESLHLPSQIKQYSNALILDLVTEFQKQSEPLIIPWKPIIIVSSVIMTIFAGSAIANHVLTDWAPIIKDMITSHMSIASLSLSVATQIGNLSRLINENTTYISQCAQSLISVNQRVDQQQQQITQILDSLRKNGPTM